ncbi:MAG TPA: mannose-1-phosphate guanylyltransferase/mannose-6-phosphate isomerase [Alphaproteobacteria bacterium]
MTTLVPVLLAGGLGTRLWPLSREVYPKQLMALTGPESLLQQAARRALLCAPAERVVTVTTESHYFPVRDQLDAVDPRLTGHLLLEPAGRNTAAAVAVAALYAETLAKDATLFVAPADHVVRDADVVAGAVRLASGFPDHLVTFGIKPDRAETGYGYIECGERIDDKLAVNAVSSFIEKPDAETAQRLIDDRPVLWNSGMFVFRARLLIEELMRHAPAIGAAAEAAFAARRAEAGAVRFPADRYAAIPAAPIDTAVMERSDKVAVVPIDPGWSDVGSWLKLWQASERDAAGNAVVGDALVEDSRNCLVRSTTRLVACAGLDELVVTETADAVLVAALGADGAIRRIVERLREAGREEAVRHLEEMRPWGSFRVLLAGPRFKIKEIVVKPGARLSLQAHQRRSEHWVVVAGTARITSGEWTGTIGPNRSAYVPVGARHRIENPGEEPLHIVEVQCGDYVGEDDIVRFEDAYGREHMETTS